MHPKISPKNVANHLNKKNRALERLLASPGRFGYALWVRSSLIFGLCCFGLACGEDDPKVSPADAGFADAQVEDAGFPDLGVVDAGEPLEPNLCDALGLPRQAFQTQGTGALFGELAGDFTTQELNGQSWTLSENWTGCESYVFLNFFNSTYGNSLWRSAINELVLQSPPNVQYFFTSDEATPEQRRTRLEAIQSQIDDLLSRLYEGDQLLEQQARFHYVSDRGRSISGSVGAFITDYLAYIPNSAVDLGDRGQAPAPAPFVFAIDRQQRWDAGDNLNEYVGGPVSFRMARYLADFYDFKANLAHRFAQEPEVTVIPLVDTTTTTRILIRSANLPNAATMATFDTWEFDLSIVCNFRNPFACSEWDRNARVELCADASCAQRQEVVRWITPYWRRGEQRWAMNATPLLGLVQAGGQVYFRIETGPEWERPTEYDLKVSLRFSNQGVGQKATGAVLAFRGGDFGPDYNVRKPFFFTPPAQASGVALAVIVSGHGQTAGDNCAEWCDHRHQFGVNGDNLPTITSPPGIGSGLGCADRAKNGVPPGQWGNWAPQRAYWCPGLPVDPILIDITDQVTLGQENELTYSGNFEGGMPQGGYIDLSVYVVWYN